MSIAEDLDAMKQRFVQLEASVKQHLEQDLPALAGFATTAASNPVTVALANAVHLPDAPEVLEMLAGLVTKVDASLGEQKAAGVAEAQQAAAQPPADVAPAA